MGHYPNVSASLFAPTNALSVRLSALQGLALVCALLLTSVPGTAWPSAPQVHPPNLVLVLADDLGWNDLGYHGSEIRTPTIDRLAKGGVRLNRLYAYPACTQTRGAILSGERMLTLGLIEPTPPWSSAGLPLGIATLADDLREAGYATWKVGKWHLGEFFAEQSPNARGFAHFYGFLGGEINHYTHSLHSRLDWQRNGSSVDEAGYVADLLTAEAIRLLENHPAGKPFFLDLSYSLPHTPLQAPDGALAAYSHIEDDHRRRYAAMVAILDANLSSVIQAIKQRPDADNTLVLFMSDNGGAAKFGADNAPLKGGKATAYEGGIRVPGIAWWPGRLPPGELREQFISVHDLHPTFRALAGLPPNADRRKVGQNVWPSIESNAAIKRRNPIVLGLALRTLRTALIQDGWKLVRAQNFNLMAAPAEQIGEVVKQELYNLMEDPLETEDLAASRPEKLAQLTALMDTVPLGPPIDVGPPPKDWTGPMAPTAEPDNSEPRKTPKAEAAKERSAGRKQA